MPGLDRQGSNDSNGRGIHDVEPVPDLNTDANGILTSTTFDKPYVQEYFYNRTRYGLAGSLDYKLGEASDLYVQQEVNGAHAHVQGLELAYQQHLSSLPSVLSGARINGNFAYTNSKNYNLVNRSDIPQLVGQGSRRHLAIEGLQMRSKVNRPFGLALASVRWR